MTVLEVIQRSTEFLGRKGVDSPRLQAELLLAHVLKLQRMQLYLNFERPLSTGDTDLVRELVKRRGEREPLQQIVGSTSFCGFEIAVNRQVLVPRPETELLAERGWQFLGERSTSTAEVSSAWDLGTGSGCLAIALAKHCPTARICATDASAEALALAKENAQHNGVAGNIEFRQGDGFAAVQGAFDLLISNPPYIPTAEVATLESEVRDFEPKGALDGGADGLDWYRRIAAEAAPFLKTNGKIMLEFGGGQAEAIRKIFAERKWIVEAVLEDYTFRPRIVIVSKAI